MSQVRKAKICTGLDKPEVGDILIEEGNKYIWIGTSKVQLKNDLIPPEFSQFPAYFWQDVGITQIPIIHDNFKQCKYWGAFRFGTDVISVTSIEMEFQQGHTRRVFYYVISPRILSNVELKDVANKFIVNNSYYFVTVPDKYQIEEVTVTLEGYFIGRSAEAYSMFRPGTDVWIEINYYDHPEHFEGISMDINPSKRKVNSSHKKGKRRALR